MTTTILHAELSCPVCAAILWGSTCLNGDAVPEPGSLSVCEGCGVILTFTGSMSVREAESVDFEGFAAEDIVKLTLLRHHIQSRQPS